MSGYCGRKVWWDKEGKERPIKKSRSLQKTTWGNYSFTKEAKKENTSFHDKMRKL